MKEGFSYSVTWFCGGLFNLRFRFVSDYSCIGNFSAISVTDPIFTAKEDLFAISSSVIK